MILVDVEDLTYESAAEVMKKYRDKLKEEGKLFVRDRLKLLFDPVDGTILGAQGVGGNGVDIMQGGTGDERDEGGDQRQRARRRAAGARARLAAVGCWSPIEAAHVQKMTRCSAVGSPMSKL